MKHIVLTSLHLLYHTYALDGTHSVKLKYIPNS